MATRFQVPVDERIFQALVNRTERDMVTQRIDSGVEFPVGGVSQGSDDSIARIDSFLKIFDTFVADQVFDLVIAH